MYSDKMVFIHNSLTRKRRQHKERVSVYRSVHVFTRPVVLLRKDITQVLIVLSV